MKEFWRICSAILATLLSIALVLVLIGAPMALSALSLWSAETIADVVRDVVIQTLESEADGIAAPAPAKLSAQVTKTSAADEALSDVLESVLGQQADARAIEQLLATDAAKELIGVLTEDMTNALLGSDKAPQLTAEKLKQIVADNMDEILEVAKQVQPDLTDEDLNHLRAEITQSVDENAQSVIENMPDFAVLREELVQNVPGAELALGLLASLGIFKWLIVILAAVLCILVFLCRLPGPRGFRWLAVDMFIAGGISAVLCLLVLLGRSVITGIFTDAAVLSATSALFAAFLKGTAIRTGGILLAGAAMIAAHIITKKLWVKAHVHTEVA